MAMTKIVDLSLGESSFDALDDVVLYVNDTKPYKHAWTETITGDLIFTDNNGKDHKLAEMAERIEVLEERLSILPEPDSEKLEKHKMLRKAYKKYRFIEELIGNEDDDNG